MKKFRIYLSLSIVIITIFGISYNVIIPQAYSINYNKQIAVLYQDGMWHLGKNLSVGDSYTYKICDPHHIPDYSSENYHYFTKNLDHNSSLCYVIKLDFVNFLSSDTGDQIDNHIWVANVSISNISDNSIKRSIFHINPENFDVKSASAIHPDTIQYAQSIENTIFSIFKYAEAPKLLKAGSIWGTVTESLDFDSNPHMKVFDDSLEYSATLNMVDYNDNSITSTEKIFSNVYKIGYDVDITNTHDDVTTSYLVTPDIPFPLSGVKYSPVHVTKPFKVFEFELLSYVSQDEPDNIEKDNAMSTVDIVENNADENNLLDTDLAVSDFTADSNLSDNTNDVISNFKDTTDDISNQKGSVTDNNVNAQDTVMSNDDMIEGIIDNNFDDGVDKLDTVTNLVDATTSKENEIFNFSLFGIFILIIVAGLFTYIKFKKISLIHVIKNHYLQKQQRKSFSKTIHFKNKVTIKINKANPNNSLEDTEY